MRVNDARLNNTLAHGCRHTEVEDENRHNVEERGKCHGLSRFENPVETTVAIELAAS